MLAVLFLGCFAGLAVRTWGDFFFILGLAVSAALLLPVYLLLVLILSKHREGKGQ